VRRLLFLAPFAVVLAVIGVFFFGLRRDPSLLPSTLIGKPLPPFDLAPVTAGGPRLASRDMRGGPRLLNAFASWCVSCRVEHPVLLALKAKGVPIDGLDWKDTPAAGGAYLDREGDPYARVGSDPTGRAGIDLGVAAVPETFVVDGAGIVRYKHVGPISPDDWNNTLEPLMARLSAGA
jgi:cytochrome c biogenesis protein CcmG/thiol:disulfide interchange protein DsbE